VSVSKCLSREGIVVVDTLVDEDLDAEEREGRWRVSFSVALESSER
jgi:hypothetical protein